MKTNSQITTTYRIALPIAFAAIILSFLFANFYTQYRFKRADQFAVILEKIAAPSIYFLAQTRGTLSALREEMDDFVSSPLAIADEKKLRTEIQALRENSQKYLDLTLLPDEIEYWNSVKDSINLVSKTSEEIIDAKKSGRQTKAKNLLSRQFFPLIENAGTAIAATIQHDAEVAQMVAREMQDVHRETSALNTRLSIICVFIALLGAVLLFQIFRKHQKLYEDYNRLLHQKVHELDMFTGRVAHDIKNPLGTAGTALGLIEQTPNEDAKKDLFAMAQRNLKRALSLSDDLLAFARAAGTSNAATADVQQFMKEIFSSYQPAAVKSGIKLIANLDEAGQVAVSAGILSSILENLLRNAMKFMGASKIKQIEIRAYDRASFVRFEVQDSGPGIPIELQSKIFEPFVRGRQNETVEGIGLGLATVKRLVEGHGGRLGVVSEVGQGSLFWFELPAAVAPQMAASYQN